MTHLWDLLSEQAREETALILPSRGETFAIRGLLAEAEVTAAQVLAELGGRQPRRLGILANNGESWVRAMFASLRLDATIVPLPLPVAFAGAYSYLEHLARIAADSALDAILVDPSFGRLTVERLVPLLPAGTRLVDVSEPGTGAPIGTALGDGGAAEAVVQYTSGSTSSPKGVVLTHDTVVAGLDTINRTSGWADDDVMGLWLPLFHDMGLFSLLNALVRGSSVCLWTPSEFIRRPLKWLRSFASSGATVVPSPNFFFDLLAVAAVREGLPDGLDLSGWRMAVNGAEPVQRRSLENFEAVFGPAGLRSGIVRPTYGMAEATLMVTFARLGSPVASMGLDRDRIEIGCPVQVAGPDTERVRVVVWCGPAAEGIAVRVTDVDGTPVPAGSVGEIQISGPPVTTGYLGRPAAEQPFVDGGWLRTGDLGFLADDELYVVGRIKDMIIVHGQNFYAEDVEEIVRTTPGVDGRRSAAFAWADDDAERMVVIWECRDTAVSAAVGESIRVRLAERIGLAAVQVVAVPPTTIPFTSSGKVKRAAALALCRQNDLIARPDALVRAGTRTEGQAL